MVDVFVGKQTMRLNCCTCCEMSAETSNCFVCGGIRFKVFLGVASCDNAELKTIRHFIV